MRIQRYPPAPGILRFPRISTLTGLLVLTLALITVAWGSLSTPGTAPVAAPLHQALILLDPGHGGPDPGALSAEGTLEKDVVLAVGLKLQDHLEAAGLSVIMTRETDTDLSEMPGASLRARKRADLQRRVEIMNVSGADAVISIHANAIAASRWQGAQVFYHPDRAPENQLLAECIQEELVHITRETTREINVSRDKYILDNVWLPVVIVEVGFLSNPREAALLDDPGYQDRIAWAITVGIMRYFATVGAKDR